MPDREGPPLWIRVDCAWLRRAGLALDGYLSVYADAECCNFTVVHTPHGRLPAREGAAIPLSGREGRSLPQEEAILALGEAATGRREAMSGEAIRRYRDSQWARHSPAGRRWAAGACRGRTTTTTPRIWAFWQVHRTLVLRTSRDAEPWVEVWLHSDGHLEAVARIT